MSFEIPEFENRDENYMSSTSIFADTIVVLVAMFHALQLFLVSQTWQATHSVQGVNHPIQDVRSPKLVLSHWPPCTWFSFYFLGNYHHVALFCPTNCAAVCYFQDRRLVHSGNLPGYISRLHMLPISEVGLFHHLSITSSRVLLLSSLRRT
jgi:hypothetical protein